MKKILRPTKKLKLQDKSTEIVEMAMALGNRQRENTHLEPPTADRKDPPYDEKTCAKKLSITTVSRTNMEETLKPAWAAPIFLLFSSSEDLHKDSLPQTVQQLRRGTQCGASCSSTKYLYAISSTGHAIQNTYSSTYRGRRAAWYLNKHWQLNIEGSR